MTMTQTNDFVFENEEWVDRTIPEDTMVRAKLVEIKLNEREWTPKPGQRGYEVDPSTGQPRVQEIRTLEWWWEVTDKRDEGLFFERRIKGECKPSMNSNPNNKLRAWAEALAGREIPIGAKFNVQDLVGCEANITVEHQADKKDSTIKWERVADVIPLNMFQTDEPPF